MWLCSDSHSVSCYWYISSISTNGTIIYIFRSTSWGEPVYTTPTGALFCRFFVIYSLTQCSKSHCIKKEQNVDAQKWFVSIVSSHFHINMSHFLISVILIFWPTWSWFEHISICSSSFAPPSQINYRSFQNWFLFYLDHFCELWEFLIS